MSYLLCLSGGHDSRLLLWEYGLDIPAAVFFDYGQPQCVPEEHYAKMAWREAGKDEKDFHYVKLPRATKTDEVVWDCRNAAFASTGAMLASTLGIDAIMLGCNQSDWPSFPDCRPAFWNTMRHAFEWAGYDVRISTPLLFTGKDEIMRKCKEFKLEAWTCYSPVSDCTDEFEQCGECYACKAAKKYAD